MNEIKKVRRTKNSVKIAIFLHFEKKTCSPKFCNISNAKPLYISCNIWDCLYEPIIKHFAY